MRLQAKVKLLLTKTRKKLEITYNTFEKAKYDTYFCTALALRLPEVERAYAYIDDITGDGSLNGHFKALYDEAEKLDDGAKREVLKTSLYPVQKSETVASFDYFAELDLSLYNGRVYPGDLEARSKEEKLALLQCEEHILEVNVYTARSNQKPEHYDVLFEDGSVSVKLGEMWYPIIEEVFHRLPVKEQTAVSQYGGKTSFSPEGDGWRMVTDSFLRPLLAEKKYYYEEGAHCCIRSKGVQKTVMAQFAGIYFYKQETFPYEGNREICGKALSELYRSGLLTDMKSDELLFILANTDGVTARVVLDQLLSKMDEPRYEKYALELLLQDVTGWKTLSLVKMKKQAKSRGEYTALYLCSSAISFTVEELMLVDRTVLTDEHREKVEKKLADRRGKVEIIERRLGEITASGLRERSKDLVADEDTKEFSQLCNKLIGHEKQDVNEVTDKELDKRLDDVNRLYELAVKIEEKLKKG